VTLTMRKSVCILFGIWAAACARGPNVGSELPLKRVVIYRNGVGYFERSGEVDEERVSFDMQQRMVGDFLASLAIVERGGSSVRSASFPLEIEDAEEPKPDQPRPLPISTKRRAFAPPEEPEPKKKRGKDMRQVVLHLDGDKHDLTIGYLAETPVWRPSYRVVIHEDGSADLQAWGIVQNLSGEDWNDVQLSLVAGAPLAFQSTLGTPVVPARPVVSDQGEIIAAVPQGVTSLDKSAQGPDVTRVGPDHPPQPAPAEAPMAEAKEEEDADGYDMSDEAASDKDLELKKARRAGKPAASRNSATVAQGAAAGGMPGFAPAAPPPPMVAPRPDLSPPRRVSDLAAVALESGATRYDIPKTVSVPNDSATMVLLASRRVPGESVFLYSPDGGVPASSSHPFRVARFTNSTNGLLEKGPIAVFEKGSFLGQGLLDPLPPKATATVPFALERSVALTSDRRHDLQGSRLYRIESSQLWIERDEVTRTTYKVDYGNDKPGKLLVRHYRIGGTRLYMPPPGTDDNTATSTALVPVSVKPHSKLELTVDERRATQQAVDWMSDLADTAVREYLADTRAKPEVVKALRDAWVVRDTLRRSLDEQRKLSTEQHELERSATETRHSLRAIEKNAQAGDLRAKLTKRLAEITSRLEQLTKRLIEINLTINEQQVRFRDAIHAIRLDAAPPPKN
jgi:hypothetical protein